MSKDKNVVKNGPLYTAEIIARLAKAKNYGTTKKVFRALENHGWYFEELIPMVLEEITKDPHRSFYKTVELNRMPGVFADVYRVNCAGERWYIKLYIEDGIIILSCKPDGSNWP